MNFVKYTFYALMMFVGLQQSDAYGMFGFGKELRSNSSAYGASLYQQHLAAQREAEEAEAAERYNLFSEQEFNGETSTDTDHSTADIFQFDMVRQAPSFAEALAGRHHERDQQEDFSIKCYRTPGQAVGHHVKHKNTKEKKVRMVILSGNNAIDAMSQEETKNAQKGHRRTSMRRGVLNKQCNDRAMLTQSK